MARNTPVIRQPTPSGTRRFDNIRRDRPRSSGYACLSVTGWLLLACLSSVFLLALLPYRHASYGIRHKQNVLRWNIDTRNYASAIHTWIIAHKEERHSSIVTGSRIKARAIGDANDNIGHQSPREVSTRFRNVCHIRFCRIVDVGFNFFSREYNLFRAGKVYSRRGSAKPSYFEDSRRAHAVEYVKLVLDVGNRWRVADVGKRNAQRYACPVSIECQRTDDAHICGNPRTLGDLKLINSRVGRFLSCFSGLSTNLGLSYSCVACNESGFGLPTSRARQSARLNGLIFSSFSKIGGLDCLGNCLLRKSVCIDRSTTSPNFRESIGRCFSCTFSGTSTHAGTMSLIQGSYPSYKSGKQQTKSDTQYSSVMSRLSLPTLFVSFLLFTALALCFYANSVNDETLIDWGYTVLWIGFFVGAQVIVVSNSTKFIGLKSCVTPAFTAR